MAEPINPEEIKATVRERIGTGVQGAGQQDYLSWRYNEPQRLGISTMGTYYPKSRRKMRMEAEFNEYQQRMAKQEFERQANERANMNLQLQFMQEARIQAEQDAASKANLAKEMREEETAKQAQNAMNSILGYTRPDGVAVSPINVNEDNAVERIQSVIAMNPFGMEKQYVKEVVGGLLDDAVRIRDSKTSAAQQAELTALDMSIRSGKPMTAFGQYDEQGKFVPSPQAMAVESTKLVQQEKKMAEEAGTKKEKESEISRLSREYIGKRAELQAMGEKGAITERRKAEADLASLNAQLKELVPSVASKEEYDNLPSGSYYKDPSGALKRKK